MSILTKTIPDVIFTPPKRVEEAELFGFDFKRIIPTGDSLLTATVTVTLINGRGTVLNMIIDAPVVQGSWVKQLVRGGTKNSTYHLRFTANTLNGLKLVGVGELTVVD
jgi:hypothetical protein